MLEPGLQQLTIQSTEHAEDAALVAEFMFLLRGLYAAALDINFDGELTAGDEPDVSKLASYLRSLTAAQLDALFTRNLGPQSLRIEHIGHDSPLKIIVAGAAGALLLASMVLSGGAFEAASPAGKFKVQLNPLGDGIKKLREALQPTTGVELRFGTKSLIVQLNSDEIAELKRQEDSTATDGGFQRFLVSMKNRLRPDGSIELLPSEVERIKGYVEKGGGGWQGRMVKIFGRHLEPFPSHGEHNQADASGE